jgi:hypothetical protein
MKQVRKYIHTTIRAHFSPLFNYRENCKTNGKCIDGKIYLILLCKFSSQNLRSDKYLTCYARDTRKKVCSSLYKVTVIVFGFNKNRNLLVNSSKIIQYQILCKIVVF